MEKEKDKSEMIQAILDHYKKKDVKDFDFLHDLPKEHVEAIYNLIA